MRVVVVVDGDQRRIGVGEHALERTRGRGGLHQAVDLGDGGRTRGGEGEVDQRHVDGRHAHGEAVEPALEGGQHEADGRRGARLGGDHGHRRRARTAQVGVVDVREHLVVGVGVDGGHQAAHDADVLVQHLGHRREAVGGAGGVRDDGVRGPQHVVVDAVDHRRVDVVAARRRDDDLLRAAREVRAGLRLAGEEAGALEDEVDAESAPGQLRGVALRQHLDAVAVDDHRVAVDRDRTGELAVGGVVAGQVGVGRGVTEVVDRHDLQFAGAARFVERAQHVASDAAVAVDAHLDRHPYIPFLWSCLGQLASRLPSARVMCAVVMP